MLTLTQTFASEEWYATGPDPICQDCGDPIEDGRPDLFLCVRCRRDLFERRRTAAMDRLKQLVRSSDPYHVEGFYYADPYRASVARGQLIEKLTAEVDRWSAKLWGIDHA